MGLLLPYLEEIRFCLELLLIGICGWFCIQYRCAINEATLLIQAGRNFLKGEPIKIGSGVRTSQGRSLLRLLQVTGARTKRLDTRPEQEIHLEFGADVNLEKLSEALIFAATSHLITKPAAIRIFIRREGKLSLTGQQGLLSGRFGRVVSEAVGSLNFLERDCEVSIEDTSLKSFGIQRQMALKFSFSDLKINSELIFWLGFKDCFGPSYFQEKTAIETLIKKSKALISQFEKISHLEKELGEERENFLGISHDLKAPGITALYLIRELQNKPTFDEQNINHYSDIELLITEQLSLIQDFLDIERDKLVKISVSPKTFKISELITELASSPIVKFRSKRIKFRIELPFDVEISFDRNHFRRIILNLLSNAFKYTDTGEVVLGIRQREGQIDLFVSDTGRGINLELRNSLFSKFERLDAPKNTSGSGIGLSASKLLAERNGSNILYSENEDNGSIFYLTITQSIVDGSKAKIQSRVDVILDVPVLILEDDEATSRLYSRILSANGFKFEMQANIADAWAALTSGKTYAGLICDFKLPDGESFSLLKDLSQRGFLLPTLVITGMTDWSNCHKQQREIMKRVFSVRFLEKPIEREELERELRELFEPREELPSGQNWC